MPSEPNAISGAQHRSGPCQLLSPDYDLNNKLLGFPCLNVYKNSNKLIKNYLKPDL